jgi:hypothetical protein
VRALPSIVVKKAGAKKQATKYKELIHVPQHVLQYFNAGNYPYFINSIISTTRNTPNIKYTR